MQEKLLEAAITARLQAYAPYSGFFVGAAVLADGQIFSGCNIENASYGLTSCAERTAILKAVSEGVRTKASLALWIRVSFTFRNLQKKRSPYLLVTRSDTSLLMSLSV